MLDANHQFIIENYQKKPLFYSFLPGIGGKRGIPMWCCYLNRGQGIASFGVQDKEHSILEFCPAHQAAQRTPLQGFRTFVKSEGTMQELFAGDGWDKAGTEAAHSAGEHRETRMEIGMNSLRLEGTWEKEGIGCTVEYETVPDSPYAALMRKVTFQNCSGEKKALEVLDGLAELLPYGVKITQMKEMGQTAKAWMQVTNLEERLPSFCVRASIEDSTQVQKMEGTVFAMAEADGQLLYPVVDRSLVFSYDTSCQYPYGFADSRAASDTALENREQITCNEVPCCFFLCRKTLEAGETLCIRELYGMTHQKEQLPAIQRDFLTCGWFEEKQNSAKGLPGQLTAPIASATGNAVFDAYGRQTFLDNLLRGGFPERIGDEVLYIYSRKHGDMERDYNFFSMEPEYFSQGNGNFRDVNQNRRCDVQFFPWVGDKNLKRFYNALQLNGYNPLGVEKTVYVTPEGAEKTPGQIYAELLEERKTSENKAQAVEVGREQSAADLEGEFARRLSSCTKKEGCSFLEGYWSDHWTYNLDLLESYLAIYPERKKEVLYEDCSYTFRQAENRILPRVKRYAKTKSGIRQYQYLKKNENCEKDGALKDPKGNEVRLSLMGKLLCLAVVKMAALDPYAMGIEMEGGKPGWYDALNGLPGLLGSSMAEAYELERLLEYMEKILEQQTGTVTIPVEVLELAVVIRQAGDDYAVELAEQGAAVNFWNCINDAKESFWEKTAECIQGELQELDSRKISGFLEAYRKILKLGREKSGKISPNVPATYYYYEVLKYQERAEGILPLQFSVKQTPDFLEGAVHLLKLEGSGEERKQLYEKIRNSRLYDRELEMYKVNASLSDASFELGRACAFTPGWLENESVWLHMEYKYLLELLKSGMYQEFAEDFHKAAVPFLPEEQYGRSVLENSSFIASSVNPNPAVRGRGFVARLSGSTAEFLQMWQIMMFGQTPFTCENQELKLEFRPFIPKYLIGEAKEISACFLGTTRVCYYLPDQESLYPGTYQISEYRITWKEKGTEKPDEITGRTAEAVRAGEATEIAVILKRRQ
ncbi:MAG: hypothetical protein PHE06_12025 [Lachnospiraceae bacterium]|nr:hypothetical protein [Lachnospiraceae bacterium]